MDNSIISDGKEHEPIDHRRKKTPLKCFKAEAVKNQGDIKTKNETNWNKMEDKITATDAKCNELSNKLSTSMEAFKRFSPNQSTTLKPDLKGSRFETFPKVKRVNTNTAPQQSNIEDAEMARHWKDVRANSDVATKYHNEGEQAES